MRARGRPGPAIIIVQMSAAFFGWWCSIFHSRHTMIPIRQRYECRKCRSGADWRLSAGASFLAQAIPGSTARRFLAGRFRGPGWTRRPEGPRPRAAADRSDDGPPLRPRAPARNRRFMMIVRRAPLRRRKRIRLRRSDQSPHPLRWLSKRRDRIRSDRRPKAGSFGAAWRPARSGPLSSTAPNHLTRSRNSTVPIPSWRAHTASFAKVSSMVSACR